MIGIVFVIGAATLLGIPFGIVAEVFGEPFAVGWLLGGGGAVAGGLLVRSVAMSSETERRTTRVVVARLLAETGDAMTGGGEHAEMIMAMAVAVRADAEGDDDTARETVTRAFQWREARTAQREVDQLTARIAERDRQAGHPTD